MPNETEIVSKFWKALKSDRTFMLGLADDGGECKPMTALVEDDLDGAENQGPIWIFTSKQTDLAQKLGSGAAGVAQFADKGHHLFASIHGQLAPDNDRAVIDLLWSPFVAAWYKGKDDPDLLLLRFDVEHAQIWLNENSVFTGVKMMLGADPKREYQDKVADVTM